MVTTKIDKEAIGKRIKYYRNKVDLTQSQVAEALNVTPDYISRIERGIASFSLERLGEISERIETPIQFLVADANRDLPDYLIPDIVERLKDLSADDRKIIIAMIDAFMNSRKTLEKN